MSFYKKWWFWLIVLVIILAVFFFPKHCGGVGGLGLASTSVSCDCFGLKAPSLNVVTDASYISCYGLCMKKTCIKTVHYLNGSSFVITSNS